MYKVKDRSAKLAKKATWRADNRRSIQLQMASIAKSARKSAAKADALRPSVDKNHGKMGHLCSTLCGARYFA